MVLHELYNHTETRMKKCLENLQGALIKLRTGRAHTSLLDHIKAVYYGKETPLNQLGNLTTVDARTLSMTVWDKAALPAVEKAILQSDLGLNPVTQGLVIRMPLPPLTQERRRELVKTVKSEGEEVKVALRNIRRDALAQLKQSLKNKTIGEDDEKVAEEKIQKMTDKYVADIDKVISHKEQELMQV